MSSAFHTCYIKRFGKTKRRKKHQDSEKSSTFQEEETALQFVLLGRQRSELVIVVTSLVPVSFQSDQPPAEGMLCVLHLIFRLCAFVVGKLPHLVPAPVLFSLVTRIYLIKACTFAPKDGLGEGWMLLCSEC